MGKNTFWIKILWKILKAAPDQPPRFSKTEALLEVIEGNVLNFRKFTP